MTTLVGIFDSEADVDPVLEAIYSTGIDSDDVTLMRNAGALGDSNVSRSDDFAVDIGIPSAAVGTPNAATPGIVTGTSRSFFDNLNLNNDQKRYYYQIADQGGVLVFVDVDDDHEQDIANILDESNASRVDRLN